MESVKMNQMQLITIKISEIGVPMLAQWAEDPVLSLLWLRFMSIPGPRTSACYRHMQTGTAKKKNTCVYSDKNI